MLKILIWQVSEDTAFKDKALKILEQQNDGIEIVASMSNNDVTKVECGGVCNAILAVGAKKIGMSKVTQDALKLNLPEEKLLGDWIVCIPGFTLEKYRHLQRSRLSIISKNCFGGLISHLLGLPFLSPFVNLSVRDEKDCLRLFKNLRFYMEKDFVFKGTQFENNLKFDYPIVTFGDVDLYMNHYRELGEATTKWNERKKKINWYNLFVVMFTEREEILQEFDTLPYGKKVCFVPFKSDLDSAWYINPAIRNDDQFWRIVNHFGSGIPVYYDPFDMLLYGKKTPLIDM